MHRLLTGLTKKKLMTMPQMSISLVVDLGPLTHEEGINELLDIREEALDRDQDSNYSENDDRSDWETDSEIEVKSDEYISEDNSSK
jgi:hypothetical protein